VSRFSSRFCFSRSYTRQGGWVGEWRRVERSALSARRASLSYCNAIHESVRAGRYAKPTRTVSVFGSAFFLSPLFCFSIFICTWTRHAIVRWTSAVDSTRLRNRDAEACSRAEFRSADRGVLAFKRIIPQRHRCDQRDLDPLDRAIVRGRADFKRGIASCKSLVLPGQTEGNGFWVWSESLTANWIRQVLRPPVRYFLRLRPSGMHDTHSRELQRK